MTEHRVKVAPVDDGLLALVAPVDDGLLGLVTGAYPMMSRIVGTRARMAQSLCVSAASSE